MDLTTKYGVQYSGYRTRFPQIGRINKQQLYRIQAIRVEVVIHGGPQSSRSCMRVTGKTTEHNIDECRHVIIAIRPTPMN